MNIEDTEVKREVIVYKSTLADIIRKWALVAIIFMAIGAAGALLWSKEHYKDKISEYVSLKALPHNNEVYTLTPTNRNSK